MEIKTITCPNCGANTTNAQNCEYCGSLLVRFVDKGIDLSKTTYTSDSATLPGLANELKRHLELQKEKPDEYVCTELLSTTDAGCSDLYIDSNDLENGLGVALEFLTYNNANDDWKKQHNRDVEKQLETFKTLDCYPLFSCNLSTLTNNSNEEFYCREYSIDFGKDAEGAARLVSEILQKVKGWTMNTNFDMFTEVGHDNIQKARNSWEKAHGSNKANEQKDNSGCLGLIGGAIIIGATSLLISCL